MARIYTVEFENVTLTNAGGDADLFEFDAATDKPIELVGLELGPTSTADMGDAQEEALRLRVIYGHATTGNGTSTTPRPTAPGDAAASFTAKTYGTTIASTGTAVNLMSTGFNNRAGYTWGPVPDGYGFWAVGANLLVVRLMAAPADDLPYSGTAWVAEYA